MSLQKKIEVDIKKAMLARNKEELTALRSIKSAILLAQTEKGASGELNEDQEFKLLSKAAKQRRESAEIFEKEGRQDLAEKELVELEIINRYLPEQMDDTTLSLEIDKIIKEVGASSMQDMGKVMGAASKALTGKADGKRISELVKQFLSN